MTTENFEVRNEELEKQLKDLGHLLKSACAVIPGYGFALLLFNFGEGGEMFYTSNAQREDIIKAMQEFIEKFREQ